MAGGLAVGLAAGWNIANTGAAAGVLHHAYGRSLPAIGLLTTALFATHFAAQIPGGRLIDRLGARRVGLAALAVIAAGNALALAAPVYWLALLARLLIGLGTGGGFVAGSDWVRAAGGSTAAQGIYGGVSVGGGGLAIGVVPLLTPALHWRSPFTTAIFVAGACALVALVPIALERPTRHPATVASAASRLRSLWPLAAVHTASFGLSVIAGNWVVSLLRDDGVSRRAAGAIGALTLLGGLATRPLAGLAVGRYPAATIRLLGFSIVVGAAGAALLALPVPVAALALAAAALGLAAGVPFASVFRGAQQLFPESPAAAVGVVNSAATFAILAATPLVGLTFSLPGHGRIGFGTIAAAWALTLAAIPRAKRSLAAATVIG